MCYQRPLLLLLLMLLMLFMLLQLPMQLLLPALPLPLFPPPHPGGGVREGMRSIIIVAYTALKRRPHRVSGRELGGRRLTHIFFLLRILKSQCPSTLTM